MKITLDNIKHVENLARIKIHEDERESFLKEFENIISFVNTLSEIDTTNVEPTFQAIYLQNVFREDVVTNNYDREKLLQNAPSQYDGCFEVPRVVE
ncbi:MAG: Asp-tRNA(Asn)/Glu-tRNA(Gln) amidotransferase subunit GatC [Eubacteriales bacterium]|jgi:aspartyl-tRNA(Asn)/glutamyl-tRNA(Gln) amidotransferase subunit C|nr:Asp-tRNA(Asn)/Glu-tRNA(Gln) amidotransferase subunit GatC [Eubacteriales bacterium]